MLESADFLFLPRCAYIFLCWHVSWPRTHSCCTALRLLHSPQHGRLISAKCAYREKYLAQTDRPELRGKVAWTENPQRRVEIFSMENFSKRARGGLIESHTAVHWQNQSCASREFEFLRGAVLMLPYWA